MGFRRGDVFVFSGVVHVIMLSQDRTLHITCLIIVIVSLITHFNNPIFTGLDLKLNSSVKRSI